MGICPLLTLAEAIINLGYNQDDRALSVHELKQYCQEDCELYIRGDKKGGCAFTVLAVNARVISKVAIVKEASLIGGGK